MGKPHQVRVCVKRAKSQLEQGHFLCCGAVNVAHVHAAVLAPIMESLEVLCWYGSDWVELILSVISVVTWTPAATCT